MVDSSYLTDMLEARASPVDLATWLRSVYLPALIDRFNHDDCRKRLGLYQGERIPDNERNLTDVRNRVSLIIEYELARLSNEMLKENSVTGLFWSYVVANRFPDLEVRRSDGTRCLRIEVKCLQSIAEEKSANFDTLKKDLHPATDFVVVFVWEWGYADSVSFGWDRAPRILNCYVFHASSLAELRDAYWLNRPPGNLGSGYQGFDLRFAVNCVDDVYAEEEGNYGKLLRIWQSDFAFRPIHSAALVDTENEYVRFKDGVIWEGFESLYGFHLPKLSQQDEIEKIFKNAIQVGAKSGDFVFVLKGRGSPRSLTTIMMESKITFGVSLTDRYVCSGSKLIDGKPVSLFKNTKPKRLTRDLFGLV